MQLPESRYQFSAKQEKRSKMWKLVLFVLLLIVLSAGIVYFFFINNNIFSSDTQADSTQNETSTVTSEQAQEVSLQDLWAQKEFARVNRKCEELLAQEPLNPQYVALNGFAYFYRGTSL